MRTYLYIFCILISARVDSSRLDALIPVVYMMEEELVHGKHAILSSSLIHKKNNSVLNAHAAHYNKEAQKIIQLFEEANESKTDHSLDTILQETLNQYLEEASLQIIDTLKVLSTGTLPYMPPSDKTMLKSWERYVKKERHDLVKQVNSLHQKQQVFKIQLIKMLFNEMNRTHFSEETENLLRYAPTLCLYLKNEVTLEDVTLDKTGGYGPCVSLFHNADGNTWKKKWQNVYIEWASLSGDFTSFTDAHKYFSKLTGIDGLVVRFVRVVYTVCD